MMMAPYMGDIGDHDGDFVLPLTKSSLYFVLEILCNEQGMLLCV